MKFKTLLVIGVLIAANAWAQSPVVRDGCQAAGGSATAYTCSYTVNPGLIVGHHYSFKADVANTGANPTIAFNGGTAVTIKKVQGGVTTNLAANDIRAGQWIEMVYDGTNMQMTSQLGNAPASGTGDASTNTTSSVVDECVLFADTSGKLLKRCSGSGIPKLTAGVMGIASAGVDYMTPSTNVAATQMPAHTGDVTTSAGGVATTVAAKLRTFTKSLNLLDPVVGDFGRVHLVLPTASTITWVGCSVAGGTSATININKRAWATPGTSGTDVLSTGLVCDTNGQTSCASDCDVNTITSPGVIARAPNALTISAVSGTNTELRVFVEYTID